MTSPTTVLYLSLDIFKKGGIQRYSRTQILALQELIGKDQISIYTVYPPFEDHFEELIEVDFYNQSSHFLVRRLNFSVKVAQFVYKYRPDIIWSNHIKLLPLAVALGKYSQTILNVYGLEMWSDLRNYEIKALKRASYIVSDCHFTANYVKDVFNISNERVGVIWDPVDVNRFIPKDSAKELLPKYGVPYKEGTTYLMTLGRISRASRHKGYDRVLDMMGHIQRQDVVYIIAGDGDDRLRLEMRVVDEGLQERVYFLGSIPESDLVDVYNAADIFVLVSDRGKGRGEGVPLTPLEAAACGKPIIVGDEDGSQEAVINGENGFIISPRDPTSLKKVVMNLVDNFELRVKMGANARKRIEKHFSYKNFLNRTRNVLTEISK